MSVAKIKKALRDELEAIEHDILVTGCTSFDEYRFATGQHLAIRNALQTIKDIASEASRSRDITTED